LIGLFVFFHNREVLVQFKAVEKLEKEDKQTVFKIIDTMLTKKKFNDFFNKNVAAL
jgi:hypothetical protein